MLSGVATGSGVFIESTVTGDGSLGIKDKESSGTTNVESADRISGFAVLFELIVALLLAQRFQAFPRAGFYV